jgi:hypothetical protein
MFCCCIIAYDWFFVSWLTSVVALSNNSLWLEHPQSKHHYKSLNYNLESMVESLPVNIQSRGKRNSFGRNNIKTQRININSQNTPKGNCELVEANCLISKRGLVNCPISTDTTKASHDIQWHAAEGLFYFIVWAWFKALQFCRHYGNGVGLCVMLLISWVLEKLIVSSTLCLILND